MKVLIRLTMGIMFAVIVASCFSCSRHGWLHRVYYYNIYHRKAGRSVDDNMDITRETYTSLLEKNGNVFYFKHEYGASVVWSYTDEKIVIYNFLRGNLVSYREGFTTTGEFLDLDKETIKELITEIEDSPYIEGAEDKLRDFFYFKIKLNTGVDERCVWIATGEFLTKKYKLEVLNKIVEDINTYRIWCYVCF